MELAGVFIFRLLFFKLRKIQCLMSFWGGGGGGGTAKISFLGDELKLPGDMTFISSQYHLPVLVLCSVECCSA